MINWKVRFKQKPFLVSLFSALLLAAQAIGKQFGYDISDDLGNQLTYTFNTILSVLVICGIVVDPTTSGISDSEQAKSYKEPK